MSKEDGNTSKSFLKIPKQVKLKTLLTETHQSLPQQPTMESIDLERHMISTQNLARRTRQVKDLKSQKIQSAKVFE